MCNMLSNIVMWHIWLLFPKLPVWQSAENKKIHCVSQWFTAGVKQARKWRVSYTYSPRPPAPRKIPPTASASHSLDTPMMMQPATIPSRAEPTRSPWYSPMLTGFIQQAEAPHLPHSHSHTPTVTSPTALWLNLGPHCHLQLYFNLHEPRPSLVSLSLTQKPFLWLSLHLCFLLLKMSHASLKMELWFPLPLKIRKLGARTLMKVIRVLQIWSQPTFCQDRHPASVSTWSVIYRKWTLNVRTEVLLS